jgi:hypothetical protein
MRDTTRYSHKKRIKIIFSIAIKKDNRNSTQNMNKALSRHMPQQSHNFKLNKQTNKQRKQSIKKTKINIKTKSTETIHYTVSRRNNYSKTTKA